MGPIIARTLGRLINSRTVSSNARGLARRVKSSRLISSTVLGGALLVVAGSVGVADSGGIVYNGCENVASGVVRLLNNTSLPAPWNQCLNTANTSPLAATLLASQPKLAEVAISWNQQGPPGTNGSNGTNGADGISVLSSTVPTGDSNCPAGGSKFTVGTVISYACNGTNGTNGKDGTNGTSVSSQALAAGDQNCPNGGSAFTSANATTYACNGVPGAAGAAGPTVYETHQDNGAGPELELSANGLSIIAGISGLPAGNYELSVDVNVRNDNNSFAQNNDQRLKCLLGGVAFYSDVAGNSTQVLSWHRVANFSFAPIIDLSCADENASGSPTNVYVTSWNLTATVLGQINTK